MFYRRHELSQSLNGDKIVHIARNASGFVVFREPTEKALKKAIDKYFENLEAIQEKKIAVKKRKLFAPKTPPEEESNQVASKTGALPTPPQKEITRGPGGKFISKSALEMSDIPEKKSFWQKLKA